MSGTTDESTFRYESPAPPAEPCARVEVTAVLIVRAYAPLGTTGDHLAEYVGSLLENREHTLHEDTFAGLEDADMRVHGQGAEPNRLMVCAARLVQDDSSNVIYAGPLAGVAV